MDDTEFRSLCSELHGLLIRCKIAIYVDMLPSRPDYSSLEEIKHTF